MKPPELKEFFEGEGIQLWGAVNLTENDSVRSSLPDEFRSRFSSAVVYAFPLADAVLDSLLGGPSLLYLHHYRQVNYLLDRVGLLLSQSLQRNGFAALPVPASQVIDWENQRGLLSHKRLAVAAGLGWLGRNNLLVTSGFGSRVRLATVLTDAPLLAGNPFSFGCGNCFDCLSRCPAGAIKEEPGEFDLQACSRFIKETCRKRSIAQNICGLCLCPFRNDSVRCNGNT